MSFAAPIAFALLLFVPYFFWLGRPQKGTSPWREWSNLVIRILIVCLLILSLAGTQIVRAADELAVVFLIDVSDSVGPEQATIAESYVREAISSMGPADQAAVVVFGSNALVERPMSRLAELAPVTSIPQTLQTDISEAIRLALALFPSGTARRIVLLSDGAATLDNALEAATLAAAAGASIDVVTLPKDPGNAEVLLTNVVAPSQVGQGEAFKIEVSAESTLNTEANLRILASGAVVYEESVQLNPGVNNFSVRLRATAQEFARYVVQITPRDDTFLQNNQLAAFTDVVGPPRVLLVAHDGTMGDNGELLPDESPQLQLALEATGLQVDRVTPSELASNLSSLSNYASIVLVNVNAKNLSPRKMEALENYVRDLGGGLVAVGGPQSYGMGGYFRTPLEDLLPVDMQIKDQDRFPSVSIVIVIDRSGSMAAQEGGAAKIQLAAEGAVRVVELLNDFDEITVIPVDTLADSPIGPAPAANRDQIINQIRQIGAGGGGIYVRTGLEAAADALAQSSNQVRHVIVLADGADSEQKEGVPELIAALAEEGVTISTVSIGDGPDVPWLQQMAELGGGRFHFTDQAANLPQIFTQETTSIQRTYLVEESFFPALGSTGFARGHAIFRAMESAGITTVPRLMGYVGTDPKATAQVILETHLGDPLLAAWEYGLGRSVAWTSDATGRWGNEWVRWSGFPTFWSNLVRWSISQSRDSRVETDVEYSDEVAHLIVDAHGKDGNFLNNLSMEANVVTPAGSTLNLSLQQIAPGRYQSDFTPDSDGAYFIRVAGSDVDGETIIGQTNGWVLGYSPEYRQLESNPRLLTRIADTTGGRELKIQTTTGDPGSVFLHDLQGVRAAQPIWPWLLVLAVILLPADIALRRLVVSRRDFQRAWSATLGRLLPERIPRIGRTEQVSRLFQAKERAGTRTIDRLYQETQPLQISVEETGDEILSPAEDKPIKEEVDRPSTTESDSTLASRLLEKRRGSTDDSAKGKP
jgi:uncharacterized membrane protein